MPDPQDHLPVKPPVFLILLALVEEERHGYALSQAVRELSDGTVRLATGPLYRHLKRLLDDGLVLEVSASDPADDPRRRYYKLSALGRRVLAAETQRMRELVAVSGRLNPARPRSGR